MLGSDDLTGKNTLLPQINIFNKFNKKFTIGIRVVRRRKNPPYGANRVWERAAGTIQGSSRDPILK